MKNICETQADTLSSPVDIFYEGKSTTNAQNCRCIIIGNFRIFLVDARLLNVDNTCSRCYINIQMEDCDKEICLNETYSCPQEARYGVFYRKFVTPVPVNAKVAISVGQLNNASPQMIWYRIIPQGRYNV